MRIYATVLYLFLYVPIGIIVLFSFNAGRHASDFRGFSIEWYGTAFSNRWATGCCWQPRERMRSKCWRGTRENPHSC